MGWPADRFGPRSPLISMVFPQQRRLRYPKPKARFSLIRRRRGAFPTKTRGIETPTSEYERLPWEQHFANGCTRRPRQPSVVAFDWLHTQRHCSL